VVLEKSATLSEKEILAALQGRIAKFKLPKRIVIVDDLPRNAIGKVQKNLLRERFSFLLSR
jgi:malonyl-CoA/methylmalonyl-CoA synthetase